jgi:glycosyltransferase involved in cell wall biosynthesis
MKILLVHNFYQSHGGEDVVFRSEYELLRAAGHEVKAYTRSNSEINDYSLGRQATLAPRTFWAWDSCRELHALIRSDPPDVAHFHNTFPLISAAAYFTCHAAGVPVVQTLHNPRLLCPAATLYRDGQTCEKCSGMGMPWPALRHRCYRDSRLQSGVVAAMLSAHRAIGTWTHQVDRYIVSTEFFARKFALAGLPAKKIRIKPHFVPGNHQPSGQDGNYALFVGRLSSEKGIPTLLKAWRELQSIPLRIRGDGPLLSSVQSAASDARSRIEWVPRASEEDLVRLFQGARMLVWPSEGLYESFGLVAIEAFACGIPVIASNAGAMAEVVRDGVTGLHFKSGDPADLAAKVEWAWNHPAEMQAMGKAGRAEYESRYTPAQNYALLIDIYASAIEARAPARATAKQADNVPDAALSS